MGVEGGVVYFVQVVAVTADIEPVVHWVVAIDSLDVDY